MSFHKQGTIIPLLENAYDGKKKIRLFFWFIHLYCRFSNDYNNRNYIVLSKTFWSLFFSKMENSECFSELEVPVLGKILKQVLKVYYIKGFKPGKYGLLKGPVEVLVKGERNVIGLILLTLKI
jgi:hypothetical protein